MEFKTVTFLTITLILDGIIHRYGQDMAGFGRGLIFGGSNCL